MEIACSYYSRDALEVGIEVKSLAPGKCVISKYNFQTHYTEQ